MIFISHLILFFIVWVFAFKKNHWDLKADVGDFPVYWSEICRGNWQVASVSHF